MKYLGTWLFMTKIVKKNIKPPANACVDDNLDIYM